MRLYAFPAVDLTPPKKLCKGDIVASYIICYLDTSATHSSSVPTHTALDAFSDGKPPSRNPMLSTALLTLASAETREQDINSLIPSQPHSACPDRLGTF